MEKAKLKKLKIAVLAGGKSGERAVSLRSGKNVLDSLKKQGFQAIHLDTDGDLLGKLKKNKIEVCYIALHGKWGEDGCVQGMLEMAGMPYTGSGVLASALAMNKVAGKRILDAVGINTPKYMPISKTTLKEDIETIKKVFPLPLVVKPISEGSSLGVSIVSEAGKLEKVIIDTQKKFGEIFVEEYIKGQEVTVGVLGTEKPRALPVLELVPKKEFYDFEAKYTKGLTEFILPARLSAPLTKKVQKLAVDAHRALGCRGVSRVDMMINRDHIPFVHEINTSPGMTDQSDLPAQAKSAGLSFDELVVEILQSAWQ
ncbi:D-alanine--D-alanine ligase [Candidatus Saganbacteria bacterium]|nr:D-alanine--D-alanine ligase [Candidatus Saganbacteria bacterium]